MKVACARVEKVLGDYLPANSSPAPNLRDAMAYSLLGGGKRVRATLVYATAELVNCDQETLDPAAAAVEMIHGYSLIHDDLPAMDDDDLRRGKPSCHIAFGEATAVLAGDALPSLAFEALARSTTSITAEQRCEMIAELAIASGSTGMAAGQAIDLAAASSNLDLNSLKQMHRLKTGALIRACCRLVAIAGYAPAATRTALDAYSADLGLCFQICDDILDVTASSDQLGKPNGSDNARQMPTYVTLLGLDGAREAASRCSQQALKALAAEGPGADLLRELVNYQLARTH